MSAATMLEQQAHAHLWNAMQGFSTRRQLELAETRIRELHDRLLADERAAAVYAVVAERPTLLEAAATRGAVQLQMRDLLADADEKTLLAYRAEAMRAVADGLALAEHIDRILAGVS